MRTVAYALTSLIIAFSIYGCSEEPRGGPRLDTYPVTGKVVVDGAPAADVIVECYPQEGQINRELVGRTDAEGAFSIGTYESGDGAPEGKYKVAFKWEKKREKGFGMTEALGGRYANPETSEFSVTVKKGEPADMGTIELSTKSK